MTTKSKKKSLATTEWGMRWENSFIHLADTNRLSRARSYARNGSVESFTITGTQIKAEVQGNYFVPYTTLIEIGNPYSVAQWNEYIVRLSEHSFYLATFLENMIAPEIDAIFNDPLNPLFPLKLNAKTSFSCNCYDWVDTCKHALAALYAFTQLLDKNPLLIFELRGKPAAEVIKEIKLLRTEQNSAAQQSELEKFWQQEHTSYEPLSLSSIPPIDIYKKLGGITRKIGSRKTQAIFKPVYKDLKELTKDFKAS